jgi:hypothetical protein
MAGMGPWRLGRGREHWTWRTRPERSRGARASGGPGGPAGCPSAWISKVPGRAGRRGAGRVGFSGPEAQDRAETIAGHQTVVRGLLVQATLPGLMTAIPRSAILSSPDPGSGGRLADC